ncbi:MAG: TetR/AcrR family transcriptional regulator [Deltaproteobacteria bacterium]|nr:TetR/AcrR family transcriptional regulator [Deltaproteobacteria bacterium]
MELEVLDTREKLAVVAVRLFSEKGFNGTSIRDIAKEMGMSISNIYHYFGSKEGVLLEALRRAVEKLLGDLEFVAQLDLPPLLRMKLLVERHLLYCGKNLDLAKIYFLELQDVSAEALEYSKKAQRDVYAIYRKELGALQQAGFLKGRNLTAVAYSIFGVINWFAKWYRPEGTLSFDDAVKEVFRFIWTGSFGFVDPAAEAAMTDAAAPERHVANVS